jgi:hypothetical protein
MLEHCLIGVILLLLPPLLLGSRWLVEAASWRPDDIPQQLLLECPALTAFKVTSAPMAAVVMSSSC